MTFELPRGGATGDGSGFDGGCEPDRIAELYFIRRMRDSVAQAESSSDASARLVHFELAGRYSVAALAASLRPDPAACGLSD